MHQTTKLYPLHQSPFYKLGSKKRLASLLKISEKQLLQLTDDNNYRVFDRYGREIQEPIGIRKIVHKRIKDLLSRIEYPDYLFSGVKGKSAICNAKYHQESSYVLTIDIKSFYKSSRIEYVFRFFHYVMKMEVDAARILSNILCYKDFIPTGSSSSQLLAYWSYSVLFNTINIFAKNNNMIFSLYVDDMTFSSTKKIDKNFDVSINKLLNSVDLRIKKKKTKYYSSSDDKIITGCVITRTNGLKVQNIHKVKIINLINTFYSEESPDERLNIKQSLLGSIAQAQQIEPNIFNKTKIQLKHN